MYRAPLTWSLAGVRIEISVERGPPPSGVVVVDDGPARHFDGWLGLLRLPADALNPQPSAPYDVRAGVAARSMRLAVTSAVVLCAVATAGGASVAAAPSPGLVLTPLGVGHLRVGMTPAQAQRASGRNIVLDGAEISTGCRYGAVRSLRVYLMLLHGRIARIDVARGSPVHALGGIRRGDTEADVRAAFGPKVVETQHAYVPGGSYLTVGWRTGPYAHRGIRFETNEKGTVTDIYAGRHDPIRYIEGCA